MPKLDLTSAIRIKTAAGEALALKGAGFSWEKPSADGSEWATITAWTGDPIVHEYTDAEGSWLELEFLGSGSITTTAGLIEIPVMLGGGEAGPSRTVNEKSQGGKGATPLFFVGANAKTISAGTHNFIVGAGSAGELGVLSVPGSPSEAFGESAAGGETTVFDHTKGGEGAGGEGATNGDGGLGVEISVGGVVRRVAGGGGRGAGSSPLGIGTDGGGTGGAAFAGSGSSGGPATPNTGAGGGGHGAVSNAAFRLGGNGGSGLIAVRVQV